MSTFNHLVQGCSARRVLTFVLLITFLVSRLLFPVKGEEKMMALQQKKSVTHSPIDTLLNSKNPKEQQVSNAFEPQNLIIPMLIAFGVYKLYEMNNTPELKRQRAEQVEYEREQRYFHEQRLQDRIRRDNAH